MRIVATRRSAKKISSAGDVDVLYPREQLDQLLKESDFIVNALPSTPETARLFGEKEFRQMKSSAFFINIGRGTTVDEEAMIHALKNKWITGAGLDTFAREPLPPESPLWEMPGVIITPHVAGAVADYVERATDIFCNNLKRYLNGERLINVVNKKLGY
jgi:phosphoglycerate dehydrogenase-like enzyme